MSYTALDSIQWGGTPKIGVSFGYDSRRSGGDMQYRIYVTVAPLTGASYFGYPIYLTVYVDGDCVDSGYTLKQASPSRWSGSIEYDSGEDGGRGESLSSTAAESLQRAVRNYLKKGNGDLAQALVEKYAQRMTPAQRRRFDALLSGGGQ